MKYTDGITPDWFEKRTIGQIYHDMLRIDNSEEAKLYFDNYVLWLDRYPALHPNDTSEKVAQSNLGWCFGEGMTEEQKWMWFRATGASHPVFGMHNPTAEEAFFMGIREGEKQKK